MYKQNDGIIDFPDTDEQTEIIQIDTVKSEQNIFSKLSIESIDDISINSAINLLTSIILYKIAKLLNKE